MGKKYQLKLAHINDTHSHFEPNRIQLEIPLNNQTYKIHTHSGGYARLSAQIKKARLQAFDSDQPFLFLHAGDSFEGTLYFREFKGSANADLLSRLQPDAMTLGNHEIDAGNAPIRAFLDQVNFPLLAGNMDLTKENNPDSAKLKDHVQLFDYDAANKTAKVLYKPFYDTQLAIFGLTLDQMAEIANLDAGTEFVNAIETAANTINKIHQQGIKHIIVLSHLGIDSDRVLAEKTNGISLIVGGHSHTLQGDFSELGLSNMPYGETVNGTPILHAGKYAETLGLADIEFDALGKVTKLQGHNYFMMDEQFIVQSTDNVNDATYQALKQKIQQHYGILSCEEDAQICSIIECAYRPAINAMESQILTYLPREMQHTRLPSRKLPNGSEVAPWVTRSMYQEAKLLDSSIDFAIHNAGGVRESLSKGNLSLADIYGKLLPFEIPLVKYQIHGIFLYQTLESAINSATNNSVKGTGTGSFPYTYGLRYFYDGRNPLGQRLTKVEVMQNKVWRTLETNQLYTGVSSSYTAAGKEGYFPLLNCLWQKEIEALTLPSAFVNFITKHHDWYQSIAPNVNYIGHLLDVKQEISA